MMRGGRPAGGHWHQREGRTGKSTGPKPAVPKRARASMAVAVKRDAVLDYPAIVRSRRTRRPEMQSRSAHKQTLGWSVS
jgi:hypothetical protein